MPTSAANRPGTIRREASCESTEEVIWTYRRSGSGPVIDDSEGRSSSGDAVPACAWLVKHELAVLESEAEDEEQRHTLEKKIELERRTLRTRARAALTPAGRTRIRKPRPSCLHCPSATATRTSQAPPQTLRRRGVPSSVDELSHVRLRGHESTPPARRPPRGHTATPGTLNAEQ